MSSASPRIVFVVHGPAVPWKRTATVGGRRITDEAHRRYKRLIAQAAIAAKLRSVADWPMEGAVYSLEVHVHRLNRKNEGDWDNYGKIVSDALEGILWRNDRDVVCGAVSKLTGDAAFLEVCASVVGCSFVGARVSSMTSATKIKYPIGAKVWVSVHDSFEPGIVAQLCPITDTVEVFAYWHGTPLIVTDRTDAIIDRQSEAYIDAIAQAFAAGVLKQDALPISNFAPYEPAL